MAKTRIDMSLLAESEKQLDKERGGNSNFLRQKEIDGSMIFRFAPPPLSLNGLPWLVVTRYWIKKTPIISLHTFDKPCVIEQELTEAVQSGDAKAARIAHDDKIIRKESILWMGGVVMAEQADGTLVPTDDAKILEFNSVGLRKDISSIIGSRWGRNGTELGIFDTVEGVNVELLRKTSKRADGKDQVEYSANVIDKSAVDESVFNSLPDLYELAKLFTPCADYQRAFIREVLYGEEIPAAVIEKENQFKAKKQAAVKERQAAKQAETPAPAPAKATANRASSAADDFEDNDELPFDMEDEAPAPPPAKKAPATGNVRKPATRKVNVAAAIKDEAEAADNAGEDDFDEFN
ncbi:MAG: hypothetical protein H6550_16030 [Chitinophagales bacterium]|nr:hypothetical protein [Chitinophagales bacterium]